MTHDNVNNPDHYNRAGIEVIDVIETYTPNSPHLANVLKYVCRHSYKGNPLEDLKKAEWYLARAITVLEGELDEAAYVAEMMDTDEAVELRGRIKDAVLGCFEGFIPTPGYYADLPEVDDFEDEDTAFDEYGRVMRCSPPITFTDDELEALRAESCKDDQGRCSYTGRPCDDEDDCIVEGLDKEGPFERSSEGPCCEPTVYKLADILDGTQDLPVDVWRNETGSPFTRYELKPGDKGYTSESVVDALYVHTPPDRIAGDDEAATRIKDAFYNFDRTEVSDVCWNGCGEVIMSDDLYVSHCGKAFCSTKCVDDFKFWQGGE